MTQMTHITFSNSILSEEHVAALNALRLTRHVYGGSVTYKAYVWGGIEVNIDGRTYLRLKKQLLKHGG